MSFKQILESKLSALGQDYKVRGDEITTICLNPEHNDTKPSYSINVKTGVSHCFSCGYAPHPAVLIGQSEEDTEELLRQAQYNYLEDLITPDKEEDTREFYLPPKAYDINKDWRGVSEELLKALGVYYCDKGRYAGRLVFPIIRDDIVQGFDARIVNPSIVPDKLKDVKWIRPAGMDAQGIVYPYEFLRDNYDCNHIILTEGVMDAVSYLELGVPAIPTFGVSPPNSRRITDLIRLGCTTLSIGYDNDDAGRTASMKVYKDYAEWFNIMNHPVQMKVFFSGEKDCNDYLVKQKGD